MSFFDTVFVSLGMIWVVIGVASLIITLIQRRHKPKDAPSVWIDGDNIYIGDQPPESATEIKPGDHYDTPEGVRITNYGRS